MRLPFAPANEKFLKSFINKLEIFVNYKVKLSLCSVIKTKYVITIV